MASNTPQPMFTTSTPLPSRAPYQTFAAQAIVTHNTQPPQFMAGLPSQQIPIQAFYTHAAGAVPGQPMQVMYAMPTVVQGAAAPMQVPTSMVVYSPMVQQHIQQPAQGQHTHVLVQHQQQHPQQQQDQSQSQHAHYPQQQQHQQQHFQYHAQAPQPHPSHWQQQQQQQHQQQHQQQQHPQHPQHPQLQQHPQPQPQHPGVPVPQPHVMHSHPHYPVVAVHAMAPPTSAHSSRASQLLQETAHGAVVLPAGHGPAMFGTVVCPLSSMSAPASVPMSVSSKPPSPRADIGRPRSSQGSRSCLSCGTTETKMWREASEYVNVHENPYLCNSCGIRYKKYKVICQSCWRVPKKVEFPTRSCKKCHTPLPEHLLSKWRR